MTAMFTALGTMIAVHHKQKTGEGQVLDVAMHEALFRVLEYTAAAYQKMGIVRQRRGNVSEGAASNLYQTADGKWVAVVAVADNIFPRLCQAMGKEDLLQDERFATRLRRDQNYTLVDTTIADWMAQQNSQELMKLLDEHGIPGHVVYDIADIFEDPHYLARQDIIEREHPVLGKMALSNVCPRMSKTPGRVDWPGLPMGWHNEEIYLGLLGLPRGEFEALIGKGII
jgi:crotonobetainyl-CoA:carnitine CoA-transferase CaiB-like acyl-CoA transferase